MEAKKGKEEEAAEKPVAVENTVSLNRRKVVLRPMHVPGTRTIANGVKLGLQHVFGLPNVARNPYMVFFPEDDRKGKGGKELFPLRAELLVVPTGNKFVGYSTKDLTIRFLPGEIENPGVTALATTTSKGFQAIALGEKQLKDSEGTLQEPRVVIHIPRKERRKVLVHKPESDSEPVREVEVLQIVFSANPSKVPSPRHLNSSVSPSPASAKTPSAPTTTSGGRRRCCCRSRWPRRCEGWRSTRRTRAR